MHKHNRDQRRMRALIRLYKYFGDYWIEVIRKIPEKALIFRKQRDELLALERKLPAEMVAWARLNA